MYFTVNHKLDNIMQENSYISTSFAIRQDVEGMIEGRPRQFKSTTLEVRSKKTRKSAHVKIENISTRITINA